MADPTPDFRERASPAAARIAEIDAQLADLDAEAIRALRAIAAGTAVQDDHDRISDIESQVAALRTEREGLS